jgi:hypothetical protein
MDADQRDLSNRICLTFYARRYFRIPSHYRSAKRTPATEGSQAERGAVASSPHRRARLQDRPRRRQRVYRGTTVTVQRMPGA